MNTTVFGGLDYAFYLISSGNNTIANSTASAVNNAIYISDGSYNTISNTTATTTANYAIYLTSSSNNTISNSTLKTSSGTGLLLYISNTAYNNTFYWNNFTNTTNKYVEDANGSNYYNATTPYGTNEGNIWFNVMNSSFDIYGATNSSGFPSLYIADSGTQYPYSNNTTSKLSGNIVDYHPLTTSNVSTAVGVNITTLSVVPASPSKSTNISCNVTAISMTSATLNITGNWSKNGVIQTALNFTGVLVSNNTATLVSNLTAGNFTHFENWSCSVWANDSTTNSSTNMSANVTIANTAPSIPVLDYPADNSSGQNTTLNVSWNASIDLDGDSINYTRCYGNNTSTVTCVSNRTTTTYNITFPENTTVFWKVNATDAYNDSAYSGLYNYTTGYASWSGETQIGSVTKGNRPHWNISAVVGFLNSTCNYSIKKSGVQNATTIIDKNGTNVTNLGNYTNISFNCNASLSPFNVSFYTENITQTSSIVSYILPAVNQIRYLFSSVYGQNVSYNFTETPAAQYSVRLWKCNQTTDALCSDASNFAPLSYTPVGTIVERIANLSSNETVYILGWDTSSGGGGGGGELPPFIPEVNETNCTATEGYVWCAATGQCLLSQNYSQYCILANITNATTNLTGGGGGGWDTGGGVLIDTIGQLIGVDFGRVPILGDITRFMGGRAFGFPIYWLLSVLYLIYLIFSIAIAAESRKETLLGDFDYILFLVWFMGLIAFWPVVV